LFVFPVIVGQPQAEQPEGQRSPSEVVHWSSL
jgi:hypothetical protein